MRHFAFLLLITAISVFVHNSSPATNKLTIDEIKAVYSSVKDLKGGFVQRTNIKDFKRTETYKGSFFIKIPSRLRWHYSNGGDETEVIIKGDEMIVYQKKQKQAIRNRFDPELYGQTPVALLAGLGNIDRDFTIVEKDDGLLLTPKRMRGGVASIELKPSNSEFPLGTIIITDNRYNIIEIRLKDVSINTGVSNSLFEFSLPEGVRVQELR